MNLQNMSSLAKKMFKPYSGPRKAEQDYLDKLSNVRRNQAIAYAGKNYEQVQAELNLDAPIDEGRSYERDGSSHLGGHRRSNSSIGATPILTE